MTNTGNGLLTVLTVGASPTALEFLKEVKKNVTDPTYTITNNT